MKKNSKESENNSQKQTGRKPRVTKDVAALLKEDSASIDKAHKELDADREMRKVEKNTTLLPRTTIHHIPFPEAFAERGSAGCEMDDDGDGNCAIHPKGCPEPATVKGRDVIGEIVDHPGTVFEAMENAGATIIRVDVSKYIGGMDPANGDSATLITTLEAAAVANLEVEFEEVGPATIDMNGVEFFYKPDSFEKVTIGTADQFACQDGEQVIYIPCEHSSDEGIGITMPMWLAELKHLV